MLEKIKMMIVQRALGVSPLFFTFKPEYLIIINMLKLNNFPMKTSNKKYFYRYFLNKFLVYQ